MRIIWQNTKRKKQKQIKCALCLCRKIKRFLKFLIFAYHFGWDFSYVHIKILRGFVKFLTGLIVKKLTKKRYKKLGALRPPCFTCCALPFDTGRFRPCGGRCVSRRSFQGFWWWPVWLPRPAA